MHVPCHPGPFPHQFARRVVAFSLSLTGVLAQNPFSAHRLLQLFDLILRLLRLLPLFLFLEHVVHPHLVLLKLRVDAAQLALRLVLQLSATQPTSPSQNTVSLLPYLLHTALSVAQLEPQFALLNVVCHLGLAVRSL